MLYHYIIAIGGVVVLMILWVTVDTVWKKIFNRTESKLVDKCDSGCEACSEPDSCESI
jgi:hypothetical protein